MVAPPAYIISKVADPIFALVIGLGAAATRINREEKEKGRTTQETVAAAKRYENPELFEFFADLRVRQRRLGLAKAST